VGPLKPKHISPRKGGSGSQAPAIKWLEAEDNPWGVRMLDVRPVTLNTVSMSSDPQCAANAVLFAHDDGTSFIGIEPQVTRVIDANLRFPIDGLLADGVLFIPREMEHKWALFYHRGEIICVRSWLRQVRAVACAEERGDHIVITAVRGTLVAEDEDPELTTRVLDYLLRSHALDVVYPAPLPAGLEKEPGEAAMWCMSMFGDRALFATPHHVVRRDPDKPLRTHSLLHIGVAWGDVPMVEASLAAGMPIDLLAGDGLAPLHWSLACADPEMMNLLLRHGSPVDVRSSEGATPLMTAVQSASVDKVTFLIDHGADVNAHDRRGFTALHRAAGMGNLDVVRLLLHRGASPNPEAEGHTPRSLAEARSEAAVVALISEHEVSLS
jgi:Ankyrin repeats (3 copies)